ncbi:MAG TPA: hypothetical protein VF017_16410 [Thermoanaerobaculia bacterium]|nr:hypothetical protein [Thermoanaerobaculia bacterium]
MRDWLSILEEPIPAEMRGLLAARWNELPEHLRTPWQVVGRHHVHCGYTMGPAFCSFGCTHCYLPKNANQVPLPSFEQMKVQIDANRRLLGPGKGLQITGGDVVDAYFRAGRPEELVAVVRYANDAGVVPMLMTHGQLLLENPAFLARLVREGGLRKLALHIDITMAGRAGYPIAKLRREADLHPLREAFVDLLLSVRRDTGIDFFAAHTVTVTEANLGSIGEILHWLRADRRHLDAFRLISFQTEADVGRTRFSARPVTAEAVWGEICAGVGADMARDNLWFGHPECSNMTSLLVLFPEGRVIDLIPSDPDSRAFWSGILERFGGIGARGESFSDSLLRKAGVIARHPEVLRSLWRYLMLRLEQERLSLPELLRRVAAREVGGFNVVLHNFMSSAQVRQGGQEVTERLAACSFRGAVERDGEWQAVPMCQMNALERENLYQAEITGSRLPIVA